MREILFRGKREDNGEWVYGYYVKLPDAAGSVCFMHVPAGNPDEHNTAHYVAPKTVEQYTGLTDKNGNKIFEGDILSSDQYPYTSNDKQNYFAEVVWLDNCPAFGLYTFKAPKSLVRGISEGCESIEDDLSDFEIIGNIHDNPELIGGDK